jgi:hypothetical protein
VKCYFHRWRDDGVDEVIHELLRCRAREGATGRDAAKKVPGHKRGIALVDQHSRVERQVGVGAFGCSRCSVRNAWVAVARVTWWCQPVQDRSSKWSRPRLCLSSR